MRITRVRVALVAALVAAAVAIPLTVISLAAAGDEHSLTAVANEATARFHDLDQANSAGWNVVVKDKLGLICIDNQPVGGMGIHYANPSFLFDADLNATQPEALVYAPNAAGQPQNILVAVLSSTWTSRPRAGS